MRFPRYLSLMLAQLSKIRSRFQICLSNASSNQQNAQIGLKKRLTHRLHFSIVRQVCIVGAAQKALQLSPGFSMTRHVLPSLLHDEALVLRIKVDNACSMLLSGLPLSIRYQAVTGMLLNLSAIVLQTPGFKHDLLSGRS